MLKKLAISLMVLAALSSAAFANMGKLAGWWMTPDYEFGSKPLPPVPDYAKATSWAAHPVLKPNSPAEQVPVGEARVSQALRAADVFYVHPTTYLQKQTWVAAIDRADVNAQTDGYTLSGQAAAFNKCCRIYAPRYRQAALGAYMAGDVNLLRRVLDVAYQDVRAAFKAYLAKANPKRPLVLASHSQGSVHLTRLLVDEVVGKPVQKRVVVVYAIGNRVDAALFAKGGPLAAMPLCETESDTGCFISWDTFEAGADPALSPAISGQWDGQAYRLYEPPNTLCMNPISWTRSSTPSAKADHKGAVPPTGRGIFKIPTREEIGTGADDLPAPLKGHISAWCDKGQAHNGLHVSVDRDERFQPSALLRGDSLHVFDFGLFFIDIRENAARRVRAFMTK